MEERPMAAYVIAHWWEERDQAWRQEYAPKLLKLLEKHGGKFLVRSRAIVKRLEGHGQVPQHFTILEFPSVAHAQAWHQDPEYVPLIQLRQANVTLDLLLVEGV
jgi:uncharacterized protein (DUF1330 family)